MAKLRVLFLEPFYGGSHRAFADGLVAHSRHEIELHTLPARFWKWRMRGAALHFAQAVAAPEHFDALLVSGLMSLADLRALWGPRCPPAAVYFHETQLSYPVPTGERLDVHFGFTDITSGLAAESIVFNSNFHRDAFFAALPPFLRQMPEHVPHWVVEVLRSKASVLHPGCELPEPEVLDSPNRFAGSAPLVVWNHRWEFDKRPEAFFAAIRTVMERGVPFRVAILGENFQMVPKAFEAARHWLGERMVQYGFLADRADYWQALRAGAVVVSTAAQENFGMSIVEAVWAGNLALVPERLAYPEIIPAVHHAACLYADDAELADRLARVLTEHRSGSSAPVGLAASMAAYSWRQRAKSFDDALQDLADRRRPAPDSGRPRA
jgi:glycosyltransferase involved in cell wall biosynthesis